MQKADCYHLGYIAKLHGFKGEVSFFLDVTDPSEYTSLNKVFIDMKKIIISEAQLKKIIESQTTENYMFFGNLQQIHRQCEMLMKMNPQELDNIIKNGHDWADDHVSEAKNNMDQVFDFLMNETKKQKSYVDFEDIHEGRKKTGTKLCARGKAAAKSKFKVYPSAYANGYAVSVCKGRIKGLDGKKHCSGAYC
jgi:hypothetical protein